MILPKFQLQFTKHSTRLAIILLHFFFLVAQFAKPVLAETSLGVSQYLSISGESVSDGDIITSTSTQNDPDQLLVSSSTYDTNLVGVVSDTPAIVFGLSTDRKAVVTSGSAFVKVNNQNGPIKKGDYITSSDASGVGMKANKTGYVLGIALEDFSPADPAEIGKIRVLIKLGFYYPGSLFNKDTAELLNQLFSSSLDNPLLYIRYILVALFIFTAFILALIYYGRVAKSSVEAIGRNPLAARTIETGTLVNVIVIFMLIVGAIVASLLVVGL